MLENKEVYYFSDDHSSVTLDKSQILPYKIPTGAYNMNICLGYKNYIPKTFKAEESTCYSLLKSILLKNLELDKEGYKIISQSSFFQYSITKRASVFYILYSKGKIFIANSDRRLGQDQKLSYIGIRFEDLLTHNGIFKTVDNRNSFYSTRELTIDGIKCLYCAEIDSCDPTSNEYTEIKMVLCRGVMPTRKQKRSTKLKLIGYNNAYYNIFLFRLIVQCQFSGIDNVVIGVRDSSFNVRNIDNYSIKSDIEPFFKREYPELYAQYLNGPKIISKNLKKITERLSETNPVFKYSISSSSYELEEVLAESERQRIKNIVSIDEFPL